MKQTYKYAIMACLLVALALKAYGLPVGPAITYKSNTTMPELGGIAINYTNNSIAGGYIFHMNLQSNQQNKRWKAYAGNVTGKLVLADASNFSIYDWELSTVTGEVYASSNNSINWSNINCSTRSNLGTEENTMAHTNSDDNISATFDAKDNSAFDVGTVSIEQNWCYTVNLFENSSAPNDDIWEEMVLWDGKKTVYTSIINDDEYGYVNRTNVTFDFQMIVPEVGAATWQSATQYYFYIELA